LFILLSFFLPIIIFIAPINVKAIQGNLDLSSAQTSVGKRFAKVFCDAKREGLDSDFASEYALNNTYLKFVAFPDDDEYLDNLWNFTHNNILDNCGEFVDLNFNKFFNMQELNYDENSTVLNHNDEVISFKCELQENLQKAMKEFVEDHPNWDQYRILQAAIAGFLMQKGFQNRDLTRLYIGNMFSMNFKD